MGEGERPMDDRKNMPQNNGNVIQNLILENREKLTITGVVDVLSFDDQIVIVETQLGLLTVKGEDLRINKLSIDSLEVIIEGQIYNMGYSNDEIGKKNSGSLLKALAMGFTMNNAIFQSNDFLQ